MEADSKNNSEELPWDIDVPYANISPTVSQYVRTVHRQPETTSTVQTPSSSNSGGFEQLMNPNVTAKVSLTLLLYLLQEKK